VTESLVVGTLGIEGFRKRATNITEIRVKSPDTCEVVALSLSLR
jgi:hypothetical protein